MCLESFWKNGEQLHTHTQLSNKLWQIPYTQLGGDLKHLGGLYIQLDCTYLQVFAPF